MQMVAYRRNQEPLMQTPPSLSEEFEPDTAAAQAIIAAALAAGRSWLTEVEGKAVLAAYGVPVAPTRLAEARRRRRRSRRERRPGGAEDRLAGHHCTSPTSAASRSIWSARTCEARGRQRDARAHRRRRARGAARPA